MKKYKWILAICFDPTLLLTPHYIRLAPNFIGEDQARDLGFPNGVALNYRFETMQEAKDFADKFEIYMDAVETGILNGESQANVGAE